MRTLQLLLLSVLSVFHIGFSPYLCVRYHSRLADGDKNGAYGFVAQLFDGTDLAEVARLAEESFKHNMEHLVRVFSPHERQCFALIFQSLLTTVVEMPLFACNRKAFTVFFCGISLAASVRLMKVASLGTTSVFFPSFRPSIG